MSKTSTILFLYTSHFLRFLSLYFFLPLYSAIALPPPPPITVHAEYRHAASLAKFPQLQVYRPKRNIFGMLRIPADRGPKSMAADASLDNQTMSLDNQLLLPSNDHADGHLHLPLITPTFQTEVEEQPERSRAEGEKKVSINIRACSIHKYFLPNI